MRMTATSHEEVLPLIRNDCNDHHVKPMVSASASARISRAILFFRHPDLFGGAIL